MLQVCGYFCASVFESRVNEKAGRGKKNKNKSNTSHLQSEPMCMVAAALVLKKCENQHFFFRALWQLSHTRSAHRTFSRSEGSMESESAQVWPFYFGRIGSQATERLLERFGQEGSFLLRDSDTVQGLYCLCVR